MQSAGAGAGRRDAVRLLTAKISALALEELRNPDTQRHIREQVADPLMKALLSQLMPYVLIAGTVFVAMLVISVLTLVLSAMFYFKSR